MNRLAILESDQVNVWCVPALKLIHHEMASHCHSEPFRNALTAGTDALLEHGCTGWLSDDRNNGPLSPEDAEWAKTVWFPRTRAAGWTHWAMVKPKSVISQLNVQQFIDLYGTQGITVRIFEEPDAALSWLRVRP